MTKRIGAALSRRSVIRGAAAVAISVAAADLTLIKASNAWGAEPYSPELRLAETNPISIDDYVRSVPQSGDETGQTTLLEGVRDEYQKAVAIFPLPLPRGYAFPAESQTKEPEGEAGTRFSAGTGAAEAYFFWQNATATAAYSAYLRGEDETSRQILNAVISGYATPVRKMYVQDPYDNYVAGSITPASNGNFGMLRAQGIDEFIGSTSARAIAAKAGDTF